MNKDKKYINIKNLIVLCLLFLLFFFSYYFRIIPIKLFRLNPKKDNAILTLFSDIVLLIILLLIYRKELIKEFKIFKKNFLDNIDIATKYWLLGLFIMLISNLIISFILKVDTANNEKLVRNMISNSPWIMLLTAGIIAPIIEELVFRKSFKNAFPNKYIFIISSGLIFGMLHVVSATTMLELLYIIPYSSLGIAFAIIYYKTDTIFSSIFVHILHNSILILLPLLI